MLGMLRGLWSYRGFIYSSIRNEFIIRFSRSTFGGFWILLQPLFQVVIYALVLSAVLSAKLPNIDNQYAYAIYLTSGTLVWSFFTEIVNRCLTLFIDQSGMLKKMMFPRITLPAIVVGSSLLNNLMLLFSVLTVFSFLAHFPGMALSWLPILTLLTIGLGLGVGLILGVLNVFLRDIGQVVPIVLQVLFWLTPIVYPISIIPDAYRDLLTYNPVYPLVKSYQDILVFGVSPDIVNLTWIAGIDIILLLAGLVLFRRASAEMVDIL